MKKDNSTSLGKPIKLKMEVQTKKMVQLMGWSVIKKIGSQVFLAFAKEDILVLDGGICITESGTLLAK